MKKVFVTFASSNLYRSLNRIYKQAVQMGVYDEFFILDESDLSARFAHEFEAQLEIGSRGFAYWSWKPQILLQVLEKVNEGDVIQYTDAGCHLRIAGIKRLNEYFNMAQTALNGILAFQAGKPETIALLSDRVFSMLPDRNWTKGDLLDYLEVRNNDEILDSPTIGAGIIFIRKCPESMSIIKEWLEVVKHDFRLIDDTPSRSPNFPTFIEHRHDQAIFSLLCKMHGVTKLSACEYRYPSLDGLNYDWTYLESYPIHAVCDLDRGAVLNTLAYLKRKLGKSTKPMRVFLRSWFR